LARRTESGIAVKAAPLSPKKLLHSQWTAVAPKRKEKHFLVSKVLEPESEGGAVEFVELEAVYSKRSRIIPWRDLQDPAVWRRGWVQETE
jgi:tryptophan-rich hypothetical protein